MLRQPPNGPPFLAKPPLGRDATGLYVTPVVIHKEDVLTIVPPLRDVMGNADDHSSGFACHAKNIPRSLRGIKK